MSWFRRHTLCVVPPRVAVAVGLVCSIGPVSGQTPGSQETLDFGIAVKEAQVAAGAREAVFPFAFTNVGSGLVVIDAVRTSCGCTIARLPELPWNIAAGEVGEFDVVLDLRGRRGTITKSIFLSTSVGIRPVTVRAILAGSGAMTSRDDRQSNLQAALADPQAIFRGDCASCHATPARGKTGAALYLAICGICHDSHNRASMVPDLRRLPHPTDRDHWIKWTKFGRQGSLMPGFARSEGGPLSEAQIDSLADYLTQTISHRRVTQTQSRSGPLSSSSAPEPSVPPPPALPASAKGD